MVGLTGGVASGKSVVCGLFRDLGTPVIDADEAARVLVRPGTPGLDAVVRRFGAHLLTPAGELDRPRLRRMIFADSEARRALEGILHPLIRQWMGDRLDEVNAPLAILAVPLLVETGRGYPIHRTLVVDCPESLQLQRLMARDGVSDSAAQAMLAAQCSRRERLAVADDIIDNRHDLETLQSAVQALHQRYLALVADPAQRASRVFE